LARECIAKDCSRVHRPGQRPSRLEKRPTPVVQTEAEKLRPIKSEKADRSIPLADAPREPSEDDAVETPIVAQWEEGEWGRMDDDDAALTEPPTAPGSPVLRLFGLQPSFSMSSDSSGSSWVAPARGAHAEEYGWATDSSDSIGPSTPRWDAQPARNGGPKAPHPFASRDRSHPLAERFDMEARGPSSWQFPPRDPVFERPHDARPSCFNFSQGNCNNGESCKYAHRPMPICRQWAQGLECQYGTACKYRHTREPEHATHQRAPSASTFASRTDRPSAICYQWARGLQCKYGDACRYRHSDQPARHTFSEPSEYPLPICQRWAIGVECPLGDACQFRHPQAGHAHVPEQDVSSSLSLQLPYSSSCSRTRSAWTLHEDFASSGRHALAVISKIPLSHHAQRTSRRWWIQVFGA
jgi:hypothetical protein